MTVPHHREVARIMYIPAVRVQGGKVTTSWARCRRATVLGYRTLLVSGDKDVTDCAPS